MFSAPSRVTPVLLVIFHVLSACTCYFFSRVTLGLHRISLWRKTIIINPYTVGGIKDSQHGRFCWTDPAQKRPPGRDDFRMILGRFWAPTSTWHKLGLKLTKFDETLCYNDEICSTFTAMLLEALKITILWKRKKRDFWTEFWYRKLLTKPTQRPRIWTKLCMLEADAKISSLRRTRTGLTSI